MPARGFSGNQIIVEGCRTCEHGIDEGDGLGCEIFCWMVKDRDFCILYNDDPSALHYFRILPRFHQGKFYKMGFDAKNKSLDAFPKVIAIVRPEPQEFQKSMTVSGLFSQLNILDYLAEGAKQEKKDKQKLRKLKGYYSKQKHLGKETQKLKNYRRK